MPDRTRSTELRAAIVFLLALSYFALFHRYGFFVQDEGVIAYQALRVSQGQVPYADFQTAYTPASFYVHAALFKIAGPGLAVLRASASVVCALTATLLFVAASRVLRAPWVFLPSLLYVLLEDQESRGFVVHTIAYPARYVTMLWALGLCLALAYARAPRAGRAVALGLVTAAIAAFKHTAGVYDAWAAGLTILLVAARRAASGADVDAPVAGRARVLAAVPALFCVALLGALPPLLRDSGGVGRAVFLMLFLPIVGVVVSLLPWTLGWSRRVDVLATAGAQLVWFGAAALVPTALWVVYFAVQAGWGRLFQRLILDGPAVAQSYAIPPPAPGPLAIAALVLVALAVLFALLIHGRVLDRTVAARIGRVVTAAAGVGVAGWVVWLAVYAVRTGGFENAVMHGGRSVDNAGYYVAAAVAFAFLTELRARPGDAVRTSTLVCWVHGICQLCLAYPRFDSAHLYEGLPILLVPGTVWLHRAARSLRTRDAGAGWVPAGIVATLALVLGLKLAPRLQQQLAWSAGPACQMRTWLAEDRGGLYGTEDAEWFAAVNRTVALIRERTPPSAAIFAYPALPAMYFLSGRENPTEFDYFYRGFGEGPDEIAIVEALERSGVPLVVTMTDYTFDPEDRGYFPVVKDYLRRHFVQTELIKPFRVLTRVAR